MSNKNDRITITFTRRRLTEILMGLVALFFASGAVATVLKYLWPKTTGKGQVSEVRIASVDEIQTGSAKMFNFNGKAAILLKTPGGFRAYGAVCTHLGCIVKWKIDENIILCPCHLGKFDPNTGKVVAGPPPSRLPTIIIKVKEGSVYALKWKDPAYVKTLSMYAGAA